RQSLPKSTADRPISEPTERSIPPLTITGVSATASSPISTLSRTTSKALARVRKFVPIAAKTRHSSTSRPIRICCAGSSRPGRASARLEPGADVGAAEAGISIRLPVECVRGDGQQDDQPLDRLLPLRLGLEEYEGRADRAEQRDPDQGAEQGAASPRDRRPPDDRRGDDLELEAGAVIGVDGGEPDGAQDGRQARQGPPP